MENQKLLSVKDVCDMAGVGMSTFRRYRHNNPDMFKPAAMGKKNQPLFSADVIEQLKNFRDSGRKKSGNAFNTQSAEEGADVQSDSKVSSSTADSETLKEGQMLINVEVLPPLINRADFNTLLLHAEKISNGQRDFYPVLEKELHDLLGVEVDAAKKIVGEISNDADFLNHFKGKLAQFPFFVEWENVRYHLVGSELEIVDTDTSRADVNVSLTPAPSTNLFATPDTESLTIEQRVDQIRRFVAIKDKIDAAYTFAVGRELIALKKQAGHGHFKELLEQNGWDIRRAQEYMTLARRFGNTRTSALLSKSQLNEMLALPDGAEEDFIAAQTKAGQNVENLSVRELRKAIREWNLRGTEIDCSVSGGEYFNVTGKAQNDSVVEELNAKPPFEDSDSGQQEGREGVQNAEGVSDIIPSAKIDSDAFTDTDTPKKNLPPIANNRNLTTEWYTPAVIIEAARAVLDTIDLDPASSPKANETVRAAKIFTAEDNGLSAEWKGRVWLNPPYASGLIEKFAEKIVEEYGKRNVTAAVVLTDNATETKWFRCLAEVADAIVFTDHRINFLNGGTFAPGSPTRGQAFFYFGHDSEKFFEVFGQFGWGCTVRRVQRL